MIIEVTQDDIDCGVPQDGCECPIARALIRAFPEQEPFVELYTIQINDSEVPTTQRIRDFIQDFDANRPVQPTRFRVKLP